MVIFRAWARLRESDLTCTDRRAEPLFAVTILFLSSDRYIQQPTECRVDKRYVIKKPAQDKILPYSDLSICSYLQRIGSYLRVAYTYIRWTSLLFTSLHVERAWNLRRGKYQEFSIGSPHKATAMEAAVAN